MTTIAKKFFRYVSSPNAYIKTAVGIVAIFVFGSLLAGSAVLLWDLHLKDSFRLEIAKAGLQLVVIAGLGGIVTFLLGLLNLFRQEQIKQRDERRQEQIKQRDERRQEQIKQLDEARRERNQIDEYRLRILREVIASYNKIKSARRILRAYGFNSDQATTLTRVHVTEFVTQMRILNEAQLSLEMIKREIKAQRNLFQGSTEILHCLGRVEKYINHVIQDWECHGEFVWSGANSECFSSLQLEKLVKFLAKAEVSFRHCAARPLDTLVRTISRELLRGQRMDKRSSDTLDALDRIRHESKPTP